MIYLKLFLSFLHVGFFAIGGAYSFLPLIEKEVVDKYAWLTKEEFLDVLAMVKVFPGAISIKFATYTGYKLGGIPGAICANVGNLLAPVLLILCVSVFYHKYKGIKNIDNALKVVQFAVFGMIIAVAFQLIKFSELFYLKNILIAILVFVLFMYTKIHPAVIIILAGIWGFFMKG